MRLSRKRVPLDLAKPLFFRRPLRWSDKDLSHGDRVTAAMIQENPLRIRQLYRLRQVVHQEELGLGIHNYPGTTSKNHTPGSGPPGSLPPGAPGPTNLKAVHRGRGRWVVVDENGQPQGDGTMTQAEAEKLVASSGG